MRHKSLSIHTWYDPAGNVSEIKHTNASGTTLLDYQYQWDSADRLSSETDTYNGTPTTTTYGYDASNELTSANSATFTYDANGNRTMAGYQTGADNELLSDGTWNYTYDPAGNMISQVGISNGLAWYYTYDNQNHVLTASEYSNGQLQEQETNSYDVFGNLVEQDETSGGNTTVTKFANQVKNTSGVSQVWADLNATNQIQTRRVYLDAVDAVCARISSNGTEGWYLADHLGSIGAIMNNSGTVIDHVTYDPWGNPTDSNPSAGDRYKFTGQEYDSVTGQYGYRARVYDAAIGRFTTQDPTGFAAGDTNLYGYCGNAPTALVDPSGMAAAPPYGTGFSPPASVLATGGGNVFEFKDPQISKKDLDALNEDHGWPVAPGDIHDFVSDQKFFQDKIKKFFTTLKHVRDGSVVAPAGYTIKGEPTMVDGKIINEQRVPFKVWLRIYFKPNPWKPSGYDYVAVVNTYTSYSNFPNWTFESGLDATWHKSNSEAAVTVMVIEVTRSWTGSATAVRNEDED